MVADATGLPATGTFRLRLDNAAGTILRVDSRAGATLTVTVEQDDGNAAVGIAVTLVVTAGAMLQLKTDASAGGSGFTPLNTTGWTWVNQGGASVVVNGQVTTFLMPGTAGTNVRTIKTSTPATPWTVIAAVHHRTPANAVMGLGLRESGTGKLYGFYLVPGTPTLNVAKYTNQTTFSATAANPALPQILGSPLWLRIRDSVSGTALDFAYSYDGSFWTQIFTEARTTFMAGGPNEFGLLGDATAAGDMSVMSWLVA